AQNMAIRQETGSAERPRNGSTRPVHREPRPPPSRKPDPLRSASRAATADTPAYPYPADASLPQPSPYPAISADPAWSPAAQLPAEYSGDPTITKATSPPASRTPQGAQTPHTARSIHRATTRPAQYFSPRAMFCTS